MDRLRQDQAARESVFQQQLAERDAVYRKEIGRATDRLEGVQSHMLMQVSEARDAQKHAKVDVQSVALMFFRLSLSS